ncbi:MAG TPA: DUF5700 domain-containing putative Zn-dependent protease, partial [Candidatus Eisenbacteria bacterium]|nr:DUF5700 domain-containing putative Zn-dependent protease [Candidatus Eisenbacteria bacterium]
MLVAGGCASGRGGAGGGAAVTGDAAVSAGTRSAAPLADTPRALTRDDIALDFGPAASVLQFWQDPGNHPLDRAAEIATSLPYRTLRGFLASQMSCVPDDRAVAKAITNPSTDGICGFGLDPAWKERASLDSLLFRLVDRSAVIRGDMARDVGVYVPRSAWRPIRVWFVVASRWMFDAVTLDRGPGDGSPVILFNLSEALEYGGNTEARAAVVERVLAHEAFHAALRQFEFGPPGWYRYHEPKNAFDHIARVMLDEGVAHYIDWKGRPGADTLFAAKPGARERRAFEQLALASRRLRDPYTDPDERAEILGLAGTGPLWSKY